MGVPTDQNPYRSFPLGSQNSPLLTNLLGGAEVAGLTTSLPPMPYPPLTQNVARIGRADAGQQRVTSQEAAVIEQDLLRVVALADVKAPKIMAISASDLSLGTAPGAPVALQRRGVANNPDFTPGAAGWQTIDTLERFQTFNTTLDRTEVSGSAKSYAITAAFTPYAKERVFKFNSLTTDSPLYLTDNGLMGARLRVARPNLTPTITPTTYDTLYDGTSEESIFRTGSDTYYVRAGTTRQLELTAYNGGNNYSKLPGTLYLLKNSREFESEGFSLTGGESITHTVALTGERGTSVNYNLSLSYDYDNRAGNDAQSHQANVAFVGPDAQFTNAPAAAGAGVPTFDLGRVNRGQSVTLPLEILNAIADIQGTTLDNLTLLTGLSSITGPDAAAFAFTNRGSTPGTTQLLDPQEAFNALIRFTPTREGTFSAVLNLPTDQNGEQGFLTNGQTFQIALTGTTVPEPASLALLGGVALLARRRRRRPVVLGGRA